ncbi:MAG: M56 family metallopeptidase [Clostridiales bacterium]|jgi:beta-lactamase regulating signal transducer with metallopeptidase domain|nr:M56 family metallopeptidase [Clostridiales bacterium]
MVFLIELLKASLIGSCAWIALLCIRPLTGRIFSQAWHYYTGLIALIFLFGGTSLARPVAELWAKAGASANEASVMVPGPIKVANPSQVSRSASAYPESADRVAARPDEPDAKGSAWADLEDALTSLAADKGFWVFLALSWLAGLIVFLSSSLVSYFKLRRLLMMGSCQIKKDRAAKVVVSPMACTPMILGVAKAVVILPALAYSDAELEMALAHELAHFRRRDTFVKLLLLLARAAHWFNPLVHLMAKDLEELCESSCDECVVSGMGKADRKLYGELILSTLERGTLSRASLASGMGSAGRNVKRRLLKMLNYKRTKKSIVALSIVLAIILGASGIALAYALPETPKATETKVAETKVAKTEVTKTEVTKTEEPLIRAESSENGAKSEVHTAANEPSDPELEAKSSAGLEALPETGTDYQFLTYYAPAEQMVNEINSKGLYTQRSLISQDITLLKSHVSSQGIILIFELRGDFEEPLSPFAQVMYDLRTDDGFSIVEDGFCPSGFFSSALILEYIPKEKVVIEIEIMPGQNEHWIGSLGLEKMDKLIFSMDALKLSGATRADPNREFVTEGSWTLEFDANFIDLPPISLELESKQSASDNGILVHSLVSAPIAAFLDIEIDPVKSGFTIYEDIYGQLYKRGDDGLPLKIYDGDTYKGTSKRISLSPEDEFDKFSDSTRGVSVGNAMRYQMQLPTIYFDQAENGKVELRICRDDGSEIVLDFRVAGE